MLPTLSSRNFAQQNIQDPGPLARSVVSWIPALASLGRDDKKGMGEKGLVRSVIRQNRNK